MKLGWKVVQMERRGEPSDRGNQLRQVGGRQRPAEGRRRRYRPAPGPARPAPGGRGRPPAARPRRRNWIEVVEAVFRGKGPLHRDATLKRWRYLATREIPDIGTPGPSGSRTSGIPTPRPGAKRRKTIEWETAQVARSGAAIEEWHRKHPVQALALRTGLKKPPADLQRLEQTHAETIRFLEGSQRRLAELEQAWPTKRLVYEQQLEREGKEIIKAKRFLGVIDANPEHFRQFWQREDLSFRNGGRQQSLGRDRDRGGRSR